MTLIYFLIIILNDDISTFKQKCFSIVFFFHDLSNFDVDVSHDDIV